MGESRLEPVTQQSASQERKTPADAAGAPARRRSPRSTSGSQKGPASETAASPAPAPTSCSLPSCDDEDEEEEEDDPYDFTIPGTHKEPAGRRHLSAVPLEDSSESAPYAKPLPPGWWATRELKLRKNRKPETKWTFHHKTHKPVRDYESLMEIYGGGTTGEAGASQPDVDENGWRNNKVTAKRPGGHAAGVAKKAKPREAAQPALEQFRFTSKSGPPPAQAAAAASSSKDKDCTANSQESNASTAPDFLQELLSGAKERREHEKLVAARVAEEVEKIMDNGIRVNPRFRAMYGSTKAKAADAIV